MLLVHVILKVLGSWRHRGYTTVHIRDTLGVYRESCIEALPSVHARVRLHARLLRTGRKSKGRPCLLAVFRALFSLFCNFCAGLPLEMLAEVGRCSHDVCEKLNMEQALGGTIRCSYIMITSMTWHCYHAVMTLMLSTFGFLSGAQRLKNEPREVTVRV